jgi:hypothetical protein
MEAASFYKMLVHICQSADLISLNINTFHKTPFNKHLSEIPRDEILPEKSSDYK